MKFVVDDKIPYIQGVLEPYGEVLYLPGDQTTPEIVRDADVLVTRTRTFCNKHLLAGSSVKLIATATIGYDHIDTAYCELAGIGWTNAPGCNSGSVEQYVLSALFILANQKGFQLKGKTIGVVGVGQVGSKVAKACELLGMRVLLNDPPRARKEGEAAFCSLDEIIQKADIISFHVPLNLQGPDATFHLVDRHFFEKSERRPILINSCRGEVFDTVAIKDALKENLVSGMVLDCWENEPHIDLALLERVDLASPHIAGYSKDGKANGTTMSVRAISRFFGLGLDLWEARPIEKPVRTNIELLGHNRTEEEIIAEAILKTYDLRTDDAAFRANPEQFEKLRGDYPLRREFPVYTVVPVELQESTKNILKSLGFNIR